MRLAIRSDGVVTAADHQIGRQLTVELDARVIVGGHQRPDAKEFFDDLGLLRRVDVDQRVDGLAEGIGLGRGHFREDRAGEFVTQAGDQDGGLSQVAVSVAHA